MAEWTRRRASEEAPLWQLASELRNGAAGLRERLAGQARRLLAAGVGKSTEATEAPADGLRGSRDISGPPPAYPQGVSPVTGALHWRA